jgi:nucleoside-diphosphate-sugar epimerase
MTVPSSARTLVIGGTGFIGTHLVPFLRSDPFCGEVLAPLRSELDLSDQTRIYEFILEFKPTLIVNLAGYATIRDVDVGDLFTRNTLSVINLLSSVVKARQRPRIITCSSAYVYAADSSTRLTEKSLIGPRNLYAVSKVAAEMAVSIARGNCDVTIARIFNAVGVGQSTEFLLPKVISTLASENFPLVLDNLSDRRDFIDVRDLCRMFLMVLKSATAPPVINFCNGSSASISEVIDTLSEVCGFSIPVISSRKASPSSAVEGDNSLLVSLGYQRAHPLADTLSWMLQNARNAAFT